MSKPPVFRPSPHTSLYLLSAAVFAGLLLPSLLQRGMFVDGVTYATVARNLAEGLGSFATPMYTQTLYPRFFEHPPLAFAVQSLFFRLLGDGFMTERIYSLFTALTSGALLIALWRLVAPQKYKTMGWMPLLLWIATPLVFWSYRNNMLENTLTVSVLAASWCWIYAIRHRKIAFEALGAVFVVCAFWVKGPVGLFPLALPFAAWAAGLYGARLSSSLRTAVFAAVVFGLSLWLVPGLYDNLAAYVDTQLLPALLGKREVTVDSRWHILGRLATELSFPLVLVFLITAFDRPSHSREARKTIVVFMLMGLAASLPLMLSMKQRSFYLVPSIAFYVMSVSLYICPTVDRWVQYGRRKLWRAIAAVAIMGFVAVGIYSAVRYGKYSRNELRLRDVQKISNYLGKGSVVQVDQVLWQDWTAHANFARLGQISLDMDRGHPCRLSLKGRYPDAVTEGVPALEGLGFYRLDCKARMPGEKSAVPER